MLRIKSLIAVLCLLNSPTVYSIEASALVGTWCFYEQEAVGNRVDERVTIALQANGQYHWQDTYWRQRGTWKVEDSRLIMSDVGSHRLLKVEADFVEMRRLSIMRMRKGACG